MPTCRADRGARHVRGSVIRLADHAWWAAAATPMMTTAMQSWLTNCAKRIGTTATRNQRSDLACRIAVRQSSGRDPGHPRRSRYREADDRRRGGPNDFRSRPTLYTQVRKPEQIQPPDRIGQKLTEGVGPGFLESTVSTPPRTRRPVRPIAGSSPDRMNSSSAADTFNAPDCDRQQAKAISHTKLTAPSRRMPRASPTPA